MMFGLSCLAMSNCKSEQEKIPPVATWEDMGDAVIVTFNNTPNGYPLSICWSYCADVVVGKIAAIKFDSEEQSQLVKDSLDLVGEYENTLVLGNTILCKYRKIDYENMTTEEMKSMTKSIVQNALDDCSE